MALASNLLEGVLRQGARRLRSRNEAPSPIGSSGLANSGTNLGGEVQFGPENTSSLVIVQLVARKAVTGRRIQCSARRVSDASWSWHGQCRDHGPTGAGSVESQRQDGRHLSSELGSREHGWPRSRVVTRACPGACRSWPVTDGRHSVGAMGDLGHFGRLHWRCPVEGGEICDSNFGFVLRELRRVAGLSQRELAERIGTTQSAIARLEKGSAEPRFCTLEKIAETLERDLHVHIRAAGNI